MERRLIKRGLNRIILLPIVLSILYAGMLIWQLNRMLDQSNWVQHTMEVLLLANEAPRHIQMQEGALRGYLLSSDSLFYTQFQKEDAIIDSCFQQLHQSTLDNRKQTERLDTILQFYWNWQASARHSLSAAMSGAPNIDTTLLARTAMMESMRRTFLRFKQEERRLYLVRTSRFSQGTFWLTLSIVTLSVILGLIVGYYARRQSKRFVDSFTALVDETTRNRDLLQTTLLSIGDAIIVTNSDRRVTLMNPRSEELTGWSLNEARNRPVSEVFRVIDESSRIPIENPIALALRHRHAIEISQHTLLLSKTGVDYPVEDSAAPIHDSHHNIAGAVLVFRDITQRRETEQHVEQREREFRALIDNAPYIITRYDKELCIVYVNPAIEHLLSISPQALIGRRFKDVGIPEQVYRPWEQAVRDVFTTGRSISIEIQYQTMRGMRHYDMRLVPESNDNDVQFVISIARDITDIKRTEEQLRESELRFRSVVENTPDAFYLLRAVRSNRREITDFIFEYINEPGAELITIPAAECLGKKLTEVMPGKGIQEFVAKYAAIIEKGIPTHEEYHVLSSYLRRAAWLYSQYVPIGDNLAVTTVDITERTRTETALRISEERYRRLVENASDAIFSTDKEGYFTYANPYVQEISGYSTEDVHKIRFDEIVAPDYRERIRRHFYRQFLSKTPTSSIEVPFITKFGEERWLAITTALQIARSASETIPETQENRVEGFDCIAIDITARKKLELELREAQDRAEAQNK